MTFLNKIRNLLFMFVVVLLVQFFLIACDTINQTKPFKLVRTGKPQSIARISAVHFNKSKKAKEKILVYEKYYNQFEFAGDFIFELTTKGKEVAARRLPAPGKEFDMATQRVVVDGGRLFILPRSGLGLADSPSSLWFFSLDLKKRRKLLELKPGWHISDVAPSPDGGQVALTAIKSNQTIAPSFPLRYIGGNVRTEVFVAELSTGKARTIFSRTVKFDNNGLPSRRLSEYPLSGQLTPSQLSWSDGGIVYTIGEKIFITRKNVRWERRVIRIKDLVGVINVSPDGTRALITRANMNRPVNKPPVVSRAVLNLDGGGLTTLPKRLTKLIYDSERVKWSGDNHLVFFVEIGAAGKTYNNTIFIIDSNGKLEKRIFIKRNLGNDSSGLTILEKSKTVLVILDRGIIGGVKAGKTLFALSLRTGKTLWSREFSGSAEIVGGG